MLHFPDNPEIDSMTRNEKLNFLRNFNFLHGNFQAIISDFGLSTVVVDGNSNLSICGTPLYSSP
jgi:hypothetical protein